MSTTSMGLNSSSDVFVGGVFKLVSVDFDEYKDEISGLQEFLEKKLSVKVKVADRIMNVGSEGELSRGKVKDYVERFFYRKGLSETYAVKTHNDEIKIYKNKK